MSASHPTGMIDPGLIVVPPYHRKPKPWLLEQLIANIATNGYNVAYPVVLDADGRTLVEGQHRCLAAIANQITAIPYVIKPSHVSAIRFGLQCNADGQLTAADDVFDLAELCWNLAQDGWKGEQIAVELGWDRTKTVRYATIKEQLHPKSWDAARFFVPRIDKSGTVPDEDVGTSIVPNGTWSESHFRAFLAELPFRDGDTRSTMRAQVAAIRELLAGKKLTAKIAGEVARRHAWHMTLAQWMNGSLAREVGLSDRKMLIKHIRNNVYGKQHSEADAQRFGDSLAALNQRALGVKLYHDDALRRIPMIPDGAIALVVTDPPYNVTDHAWDKLGTDDQYIAWLREWLQAMRPKLAAEHHCFIFCDPDYAAPIEVMMRADGWPIKSRIIWEYRNLVQGRDVADRFISNWQMCFHTGTHALNWPPKWDDSRFEVQEHATPQSNFAEGKLHPTAKPLNLIKHLVLVGSKPGDLVLDCFAGSGTTAQACNEVTQRRCILIEEAAQYCDVIERRFGIQRETQ